MNAESTLVILAAGMGSRFGGPKQLAHVGPSGETLLEYGLYDAHKAGFTHFVFVIRESIRSDFEEGVLARFRDRIPCTYVLQSLEDVPSSVDSKSVAGRVKPWGTGHALWSARRAIKGPCAVMNADDFYGTESFCILHQALATGIQACLVPFRLDQTLSERGGVSRGICRVTDSGNLADIRECKDLKMADLSRVEGVDNRDLVPVAFLSDTPVSMNLMGFAPDVWPFLEAHIEQFFHEIEPGSSREYGLPDLLSGWMEKADVVVKPTPERWLGITHAADLEPVRSAIRERIHAGLYPAKLWQ